jgi:hypothetical protein
VKSRGACLVVHDDPPAADDKVGQEHVSETGFHRPTRFSSIFS